MSDFAQAFHNGKAVIGSIMGGYPDIGMTEQFVMEMVHGGADMIEIRVPFSDPVADEPLMQEASCLSLQAGTRLDALFQLVGSLRHKTEVPIMFKTYLNPVFHHGYQRFFERCQQVGLDGIVILDLPLEERSELATICEKCGVELISTISSTSGNRVTRIASVSKGFLNVLLPLTTNGNGTDVESGLQAMCEHVKTVTGIPIIIGSGVDSIEQAKHMARYADGVLVDSRIVKLMMDFGSEAGPRIFSHIRDVKEALNDPGIG